VRQTPIGARQIDTFLQPDKTFLIATEVDVTDADDTLMTTYRAVINTLRTDSSVVLNAGNIQPPAVANNVASNDSGALVFSGEYAWTNPQGVFIINGQVTNQSGGPLEAVRVTAIVYDGSDNVLAQQADVVAEDVLDNGASAGFSISFRNGKPSQAVRYELQSVARSAEYSVKTHLGDDSFFIGNKTAGYNANGYLTVSGDVANRTQGPAHFIRALITILDDGGHVVGVETVFLSKPDLLPGEVGHFEATFYELGGTANRFVVTISGNTTSTQ
jgi:hypothetical protein